MKIKIRTKSGWIDAKAYPTSHPCLFITPECCRLGPGRKRWFSKDEYTITHRPSGNAIVFGVFELDECRRLAELFAKSSIPWRELRSQKDAKKYARQHKTVMRKFMKVA